MSFSLQLRRRGFMPVLATMLCLLGAPAPWACRIIIPPPWPGPWPPPQPVPMPLAMEVRSHQASIEIDGHRARVTVEALFHNPNPSRVEGTYLFPVAPLAAVSSFAMTVDGKTVEAELVEADKARKIYEDIVRRQRDPALLEYLDQGLLRARVFPIEPGKDVKVTLAYEQVVRQEGTRTRLVYPLVSVRPEGGNKVEKLRIDVTIRADTPVKGLFCPGFDAAVKKLDANSATVSFEATSYLPDKDFEVIFSQDKRKVGVDFLATRRGDDGYFLMLVAPNSELQAAEIAAKDIVFVLDTSGSMQGDKLNQAKQALLFCVNNLNATDSFNLITFANDVNPLSPQPVPATEANRAKARTFIEDIKALGGTALDDVLAAVVAMPPKPGHVPLAVLLTDGLPTVGEIEPGKILSRVDKHGDRRFFTFGVGYDVNTRLLDGIAAGAGGTSSYVRPGENLELALSSFYEKVAFPVLTDLQLDTGTAKLMDMNPRRLPDLFKGGQALITGRFTGTGKLSMTLSGVIGGARETFPFDADLTGETRNAFIPRLWAVSRVGFLQEQIRLNGQNAELVDEIKRLGK